MEGGRKIEQRSLEEVMILKDDKNGGKKEGLEEGEERKKGRRELKEVQKEGRRKGKGVEGREGRIDRTGRTMSGSNWTDGSN